MLPLYRSLSLQTRLLILGLLLLIGAAVSFAYHQNLLLLLGAIAVVGVAVDIVAHRPRLILATLVTVAQIALIAYLSFTSSALLGVANETSADLLINLLISVYGLIALLLLDLIVSIYVLRGRIWFNLLIFTALTDLTFLYFTGITENVTLGLLLVLAITIIYGAIRFPYRRVKFESRLQLKLDKNTERRVGNVFENKSFRIKKTDNYDLLSYVALPENATRLYALCVVDDHMRFAVKNNRVLINDADFTPGIEVFLSEIKKFAKTYKIPRSTILPVLLHVNHDNDVYAKQVAIINRNKPDLKLGDVYLVNTAGLNRITKVTARLKAIRSKKVLERIENLFSVTN